MVRGAYKYVPKELIEELEKVKINFNVGDSDCFRRIAEDSRIGREIRMTIDLNVRKKR